MRLGQSQQGDLVFTQPPHLFCTVDYPMKTIILFIRFRLSFNFCFRFRQGKMYRYNLQSHDVQALIHFATDGFKKIARSEPVPVPKSPL